MSRPHLLPLALLLPLLAVACGDDQGPSLPTFTVDAGAVELVVRASGELEAETSTRVKIPSQLKSWQTISWIADEGSEVAEGDPVVIFSETEILIDESEALSKMGLEDLRIRAADQDFAAEELHIVNELAVLQRRREVAEAYAPTDEILFSRTEIIEAAIDLEYLEIESDYLAGESTKLRQRHATDLELLGLQRRTHEVKLDQARQAKESLVLRAPHAGVFLLDERWKDGQLAPGARVHPFWQLGELPDLSRMLAKVWVHEAEATGLELGMAAEVTLEADPTRRIAAEVESIAGVAAPLVEDSPVRYIEVKLRLAEQDPHVLRPKHKVEASIFSARLEEAVAVPNQALFHEAGESWVWALDGREFARRPVTLGRSSALYTIVSGGLEAGEVIALAPPEER